MNFSDRKSRVHGVQSQSAVNANYFQHRAWQLLALNEKISGVWPYQSKYVQCPLQMLHLFGLSSMMFALLNGLRTIAADDAEIILENGFWISFTSGLTCILLLNLIGQRHRQKFYERVVKHYLAMGTPEEAAVLRKSADQGSIFVVFYLGALLFFVVAFYSIPMIQALYEYSIGREDELKITLGAGLDYGVDHGKYWLVLLPIFVNYFFSGFVVGAGFEFSFILQVRHVRALFKIVRIRLDGAMELVDDDDESTSMIVSAVELHLECIEMVDMIEANYSTFFLLLLLANSALFAVGLHMFTHNMQDPLQMMRFGCLFALITLHFYVIYDHGQMIIDSSLTIYDTRYQCEWLNLPKKSRKLFTMLMKVQSTNACQLTGGKLFPLSMEMFGKMFKAGLSYYTVLEQ